MPTDVQEYRAAARAEIPPFLLARRFTADDKWTQASMEGGPRHLSLFREHEPDLQAILNNKRIVILGEPGAGKSTTVHAVVKHVLDTGTPNHVPITASLKDYDGNLGQLMNAPGDILASPHLSRTFILDGVDEVPPPHRDALVTEINQLSQNDPAAKIVLTARQAFYAHHPTAFPVGYTTYHLLDFTGEDIRACARYHEVNPDAFLDAVHASDCEEEVHNPFVLLAVLKRYKEQGNLSPLRSDNVGYVVNRLIDSRPLVNATRQKRALRMLAITCETTARNVLTEEEATRVLLEAMNITTATAAQVLDELSHSILIKTPGRISFQMRSYGEYLAADELHDKTIDRLRELAFVNNEPVDTWLNAVTYLAEMNDSVRRYFAIHYPDWLVNVSPHAFTEEERTQLAKTLLERTNGVGGYIVNQRAISRWRLARLLTADVIADLTAQLDSQHEHEQANALILLGILKHTAIIPRALALATAHRNASSLRYSAIAALINAGDATILDDLLAFVQPDDPYHLSLVDAIGALCTPEDFPRVLPLIEETNAGLSATHVHFRELRTRETLTATLAYLNEHPNTLDGYGLDSYLEPIIDLIPEHWDTEIATSIGTLLATLERINYHHGKLAERIVRHAATLDTNATTIQAMITTLASDGTRARMINHIITPLITETAARWIQTNAPTYANDIGAWLPDGPSRNILAPLTPEGRAAREQALAAYNAEQQQREQGITTTRDEHQHTITTTRNIDAIIGAAARLKKDLPPVSAEQHAWLQTAANEKLQALDLATSINWVTDNQWTQPHELQPLLQLTDHYDLTLDDDVPIILALRAWPENAISNYVKKNGLSAAAKATLIELLQSMEHDSITNNILSFLRESEYDEPELRDAINAIAADTTRRPQLRIDAIHRFPNTPETTTLLAQLNNDPDEAVQATAFRELIARQHRPTISRAIANLTDDQLRQTDTRAPESTPLDWIGNIKTPEVIDELRALRLRTLGLGLWRATALCTGAIANTDKARAAATIRLQLPQTPSDWQDHLRQDADSLDRAVRIAAAQNTPFDDVIRKLKGATSMVSVRVWCEGTTDRPILRKLLNDIGEDDLARTMTPIGGWGNLMAEKEPEHYLAGCREAIIIMDGDNGRHLRRPKQPPTKEAKEIQRRFKGHNLTLHVLRRYGIENYLPQHACEAVLNRDLSQYFPIPRHAKAETHFTDPKPLWPQWLNRWRKQKAIPFYRKELNEQVATRMNSADIAGTDLADIISDIKLRAEQARQY